MLARATNAILGAAVADAATRPLHWLYDLEKVKEAIETDGGGEAAFLPVSRSPFYEYVPAQQKKHSAGWCWRRPPPDARRPHARWPTPYVAGLCLACIVCMLTVVGGGGADARAGACGAVGRRCCALCRPTPLCAVLASIPWRPQRCCH